MYEGRGGGRVSYSVREKGGWRVSYSVRGKGSGG